MSYSVLSNPLITVIPKPGALPENVSLRDALLKAHEYADLTGDNPVEKFAVLRFLSAFVMDMLAMKTAEDRQRVFRQGRFSEETLDAYIALCKKEGTSFDLFDSKKPFLQSAFTDPAEQKKRLRPVALIDLYMPSGNNHTHYCTQPSILGIAIEDETEMTISKAFRAMCMRQIFCGYQQEGPAGISKMPLFAYAAGKNLFETIMMQTLSEEDVEGMDYGIGTVPWREKALETVAKEEIYEVTFLQALTWQPRKIQLIPGEDGLIHKVYLSAGLDYKGEPWRDINTYAIRVTDMKTGEISMKTVLPRYNQSQWLAFMEIACDRDDRYEQPACLRAIDSLYGGMKKDQVTLRFCGIQKSPNKYILVAPVEEEIPLPETVLPNEEYIREFGRDVWLINRTAYDIKLASRACFNEKEEGKDPQTFQVVAEFNREGKELLLNTLLKAACADTVPDTHADEFEEQAKAILAKTIQYMREKAGTSAADMMRTVETESRIRLALWRNNKTRKEASENADVRGEEDCEMV